jgi:hypothetical protein
MTDPITIKGEVFKKVFPNVTLYLNKCDKDIRATCFGTRSNTGDEGDDERQRLPIKGKRIDREERSIGEFSSANLLYQGGFLNCKKASRFTINFGILLFIVNKLSRIFPGGLSRVKDEVSSVNPLYQEMFLIRKIAVVCEQTVCGYFLGLGGLSRCEEW